NTIVLPYVLEEYGAKVYEPLARLAEVSEVCTEGSTETKAKAFIAKIREMNASFGIPDTIPEIKPEDIEKMSVWAAHEANPLYPCPVVFDKARFARLFTRVSGR
ncbi:MAG: iron-containing alcohol dehydrogenase, partial [Lachnospiraceae bacterium]|nr:iron-containing alcohol dehydrogenase [Lachnospiraceae bacterium]